MQFQFPIHAPKKCINHELNNGHIQQAYIGGVFIIHTCKCLKVLQKSIKTLPSNTKTQSEALLSKFYQSIKLKYQWIYFFGRWFLNSTIEWLNNSVYMQHTKPFLCAVHLCIGFITFHCDSLKEPIMNNNILYVFIYNKIFVSFHIIATL